MKQIDRNGMLKWKKRIPLISVLLLLISSTSNLGRVPWFDEILTLGWLQLDFWKIPFAYNIPNNHIVYTMALRMWWDAAELFSLNGIIFLRLLSLFAGSLAVFMISRYLLSRCGLLSGMCCSFLLAISGSMCLFSTALRGYSFALLFCFAAFLLAGRWLKRGIWNWCGLFYFLGCSLAVGVMPTTLFALEAGVLFYLPRMFASKKDFRHIVLLAVIPVVSLLLFYAPIFGKLLKASQLKEGWFSWSGAYWNLYGTFLFVFLPVIVFALWGALIFWKRNRKLRLRILCFVVILAMPLLLAPFAQVPPFPRVFFPFFGLWTVILSVLLIPLERTKHACLRSVPPLFTLLWLVLAASITPHVSSALFESPRCDDLLHPYPVSEQFQPYKTALAVKKLVANEDSAVFIDFPVDPPSLNMMLVNSGFPAERILYDRPDYGKVIRLEPSDLIVCGSRAELEEVLKRFGLNGEYRLVFDKGMQKVYQRTQR